ncbi:hypothetical protein P8452_41102 [Trifolium repens]|nr:hypothetical protein P8452_41102 [Trifolium repens]
MMFAPHRIPLPMRFSNARRPPQFVSFRPRRISVSLKCSISTRRVIITTGRILPRSSAISVAARFWDENDKTENNVVANPLNRRGVNAGSFVLLLILILWKVETENH